MKVLNLVDLNRSDIKYKISKFPDGQQQITINKRDCYGSKYDDIIMSHEDCIIKIDSRLNNFHDLELIICATKSLKNLGVREIHLYVPYFLGSRSDRQFEEGSNNYLKDVICPIINSLNFESITVLDPHSDVLEACLNGFKKESNLKLVKFSLASIFDGGYAEDLDNIILISPDAGASKKIYKLSEQIGYKEDIITCSKDRDENGKLTKCIVPITGKQLKSKKDYIIIDDICDGGTTFINIARELTHKSCSGHIYLVVTHGIFSKGFKELSEYFDGIYTTNSYSEALLQKDGDYYHYSKLVKQLNIF